MTRIGVVIAASIFAASLPASEITDTGVPVSVPVTIKSTDASSPQLTVDNILVSQNRQHRQIISLTPLGGSTGSQLWLLIDDGLTKNFGSQLADVKQFVLSLPSTIQVGIGYIHNGFVQQAQPLTADHNLAVKALRLPSGPPGIAADPYTAMRVLIQKWPATQSAREIVFISNGADPIYGAGPQDPYLESALHAAQKAGVVVYSIFYPGSGAYGHSRRQGFWGQYNLSEMTEATGGELYWIGLQPPVSLTPYFNDLTRRLDGEYLLTFLAKPEHKSGLESVDVKSELPHVKVAAPSEVYVPAIQ